MAELPRAIRAERQNVETTLDILREALGRPQRSVVELTAIGGFLQNVYNGIENILKQALRQRGIQPPRSDAWHKELLEHSVKAGLIPSDLADELYDYMSFRHFFIHGYGIMLTEPPLQDLASRLPAVWARFITEIERALGA
ncbi:MAG: hypothetical protein NTX53_18615 [candidate division WOR-3 bacterium]|nr:hypothetical protein [candidate division WOR-3 bacterium]